MISVAAFYQSSVDLRKSQIIFCDASYDDLRLSEMVSLAACCNVPADLRKYQNISWTVS